MKIAFVVVLVLAVAMIVLVLVSIENNNEQVLKSIGPDVSAPTEGWTQVTFGTQGNVYYRGDLTASEASSVGETLRGKEVFQKRGGDVYLSRDKDGTVLTFVLSDGWENGETIGDFRGLAKEVAASIGGLPITLRLLSPDLQVRKEIPLKTPTMDELVADETKVPVADVPTGIRWNRYASPDCWQAAIGEPDVDRDYSEELGGPSNSLYRNWHYNCADGTITFLVRVVDHATWPYVPEGDTGVAVYKVTRQPN